MMALVYFLILILLNSTVYSASSDTIENAHSFSIQSGGIGDSGHIEIHGQQRSSGEIANMQIDAFGRHYRFPNQLLGMLSVNHLHRLQLSYDPGEMSLNGKTLYIRIRSSNNGTDHTDLSIAINENGQMHVLSE